MIEVNNKTQSRVDEKFLLQVARKVLTGERRAKSGLSIALVGPKKMEELNKKYRKKDKAANVLSFFEPELGLGEVILCPHAVKKDAKKYGILFEEALAWMLVHGILHLLGYGHEQERDARTMEARETRYLRKLGRNLAI